MRLESITNKITVFLFLFCIALTGAVILLDYPFSTFVTEADEIVISDRNLVFVVSQYNDFYQLEDEEGYRLLWEDPEIDSDGKFFFPAYKDFLNVTQLILTPTVGDVGQVEVKRNLLDDKLYISRVYDLKEEKDIFYAIRLYGQEISEDMVEVDSGVSVESNGCVYTFKSDDPFEKVDEEYDLLIFNVEGDYINVEVERSCL